jgi:hypothetical protein
MTIWYAEPRPSQSLCNGFWSAPSAWASFTIGTRPSTARRSECSSTGRAIEITRHDLYWDDWSRYSGRQHTWMKFGGL